MDLPHPVNPHDRDRMGTAAVRAGVIIRQCKVIWKHSSVWIQRTDGL